MNIEYLKLIASLLIPIVILMLGVWAKSIAANHEKRISLNDRIIEKRVEVYEAIGQDLNDIYVFLIQVGQWKELTPSEIIEKKRAIDKVMYVNRPYWSDSTFEKYISFINSSFETWTGVGEDAKIRASTSQFMSLEHWDKTWIPYFSTNKIDQQKIKNAYEQLMMSFSEQFGFVQQ